MTPLERKEIIYATRDTLHFLDIIGDIVTEDLVKLLATSEYFTDRQVKRVRALVEGYRAVIDSR